MKNDEFNVEKITNEKDGFSSFEFGFTQNSDSSSFLGNKDSLKDEVNEEKTANTSKPQEKKKENNKNQEELIKSNTTTSTTASSSTSTTSNANIANLASSAVAPVASVSLVTVTTISALVGFSIYSQAKVVMNDLQVGVANVTYNLNISDIDENDYVIGLEGKDYEYILYQELVEGNNIGEFTDLLPGCTFIVKILDWQNNLTLYQTAVTTSYYEKEEIPDIPDVPDEPDVPDVPDVPDYPDPISENTDSSTDTPIDISERNIYQILYVTSGGTSIPEGYVEEGGYLAEPVPPTKEGYELVGWTLDTSTSELFDFDNTPITTNMVLFAIWRENAVTQPQYVTFNWDNTINLDTNRIYYSIDRVDPSNVLTTVQLSAYYFDPFTTDLYQETFDIPVTNEYTYTDLVLDADNPFTFATSAMYHIEVSYNFQGETYVISEIDTKVLDCYSRKSTLTDFELKVYGSTLYVNLDSQDDFNLFPSNEGVTVVRFIDDSTQVEFRIEGLNSSEIDLSEGQIDMSQTYNYQVIYMNENKGVEIVLAKGIYNFSNNVHDVKYIVYYG